MSASAQASEVDVVACLLERPDLPSEMLTRKHEACLQIAGDTCEAADAPLACLSGLQEQLSGYFEALRARLPDAVPGTDFASLTYPRGLARLDEAYATPCVPDENEQDFEICETSRLSAALLDLLYRARTAGVAP